MSKNNKVKVYKTHPKAIIPEMKSSEAAGFDLHCLENFSLMPGERAVVRTGLVMQPPEGYHMEILVRSSMAYKYGIMLTNNVGLIDRDFAGANDEIKVMLFRCPDDIPKQQSVRSGVRVMSDMNGQDPVRFKAGDRIAQVVFRKTEKFDFEEVEDAPASTRGGLGSTGK